MKARQIAVAAVYLNLFAATAAGSGAGPSVCETRLEAPAAAAAPAAISIYYVDVAPGWASRRLITGLLARMDAEAPKVVRIDACAASPAERAP